MNSPKRKKFPLIRYTSRDFESIKRDLNDHRKRYYSDISKDENEASFDEMMLDSVAYVGDILSFYMDYAVNESFLDTAIEFDNVLRIGKHMGFKFKGNPSSTGIATFFAIIPAKSSGLGPDPNYLPILKKDSGLKSTGGNSFILNEDVFFSKATNPIVVARVDEKTGIPTAYAVKSFGQIISGRYLQETIEIGDYQKFLRLELIGKDITEVVSVQDLQGNEYFEVDYLSQDVVYKSVPNPDTTTIIDVPALLRPFSVPRRFIVEREKNKTFLQFGFGSDKDKEHNALLDPSTILLNIHGKNYTPDVSIDPADILGTDTLGIAPSNTKLTIVYRVNSSESTNATANSVTEVILPIAEFENSNSLDNETMRAVIDSFECTNENAIVGDISIPSIEELKIRIFDKFGAQNRAVTTADYKALIYSMPGKFGAIKRTNIIPDSNSFKRNLNIYVISEDSNGSLTQTNQLLKNNLKLWLNQGRMLNDTIDILDGKIVNIGIDFIVVADQNINKFDVLSDSLESLRSLFTIKEEMGYPFSVTKIYNALAKTRGVVDVLNVKIYQKKGTQYSNTNIDLQSLFSADGKQLNTPSNVIFEIKIVNDDIKGAIK